MSRAFSRVLIAALAANLALSACATSYKAKPKFMRGSYEDWVAKSQTRGKGLLESALAKSEVISLKDGDSIRVITDVKMNGESYCANTIATFRNDSFGWDELDLRDSVRHSCEHKYELIHRLEAGDARLCSGLKCVANRVGF